MFAGVGSFSITIDRAVQGDATIISIDNNHHAHHYLRENARLNRAWHVLPLLGDSLAEVPRLVQERGVADRIIMNLPKDAHRFLGAAAGGLKKSGVLHYYRLLPREGAREVVEEELDSQGRFRIEAFREAEAYSPSRSIYVADAVLLD
jgi:tRNA (guanine37-N1)-methyltransferase